jgi:type I restriction enzyme S subunit
MKADLIGDAEDHITDAAVAGSSTNVVPAGTVLAVTRSGILRRIFPVAVTTCAVAINQDLKALKPADGINPRYVAWYLRSDEQSILHDCTKDGTTVDSVDFPALLRRSIPIAPYPEQERIVAAIEEQFSRLNAGVRAIERVERHLLQWLDSAIQSAFASFVISGPHFQSVPLEDLCERITKGTTPTSVGHKFTSDGIRFVKVESLFEGNIDHRKCAFISEAANADLARSQLHTNDILVSIAGTLGRTGIVSERDVPANTNQALAIVRLKEPALAPYVRAWLESPPVRHSLRTGGKGVGMGNLTLEQIRQLPIAVPGNEVRNALLEHIDSAKLTVRRATTDVAKCRRSAERLRSSILTAAFSGKLVPQDASDERAFALLERIADERRATNGHKSTQTRRPRPPREVTV